MNVHVPSFLLGVIVSTVVAYAWMHGQNSAIRHCRRIFRHGRSLDLVFFEDAEVDPTIEKPTPARASVAPFTGRLPQ
jgi:hypothetical protein